MQDAWSQLATMVRAQAESRTAWESAEVHLLHLGLRERLAALRIEPNPDIAVTLMAAAMLLADRSPEWGGDARDAMGELALLGLAMLEDDDDD